ncbi:uncharacterized protein LOC109950329 [Prunus persica]|uniref:uncharacterized protein LOC109950329 n=1 Tax=Prunus persica TaxID=3760 RepID=UPI0009AB483D|nr:uncharacterized protein LOC109950329 [Prunus persica]
MGGMKINFDGAWQPGLTVGGVGVVVRNSAGDFVVGCAMALDNVFSAAHVEAGNMVGQMKLMIAEEQKFQGKALSLSHTKTTITTIKEKFTEQQLQMFEQSCFGHLLRIEDLKWTSPIVHGLLLRKADPKTVSQLNGIKFIVGNKYFANDKTVNLLELEKAFLECDDVDDILKLRFVYFAVFVLLGSEKHVHIDMRYLKLAEDLEDFGKYPSGAVCYAKTNASLLRALCADYQRVKVPTKTAKTKKSGKKRTTTATGRPREYHLKGFAYALQIWAYEVFSALAALHLVVHEDNAYIPRLLHWRSNSSPRFYELMSQVFENHEVDVQLLRPSVMDKQQPYWTWGDSADDTEELVDLLGDDAEQKTGTSASVEEKDEDIDETASLPSSSKGTVASTELRTLKRDFQRTKDELAKVAISNRALCNRMHQLEDMVRKESLKVERDLPTVSMAGDEEGSSSVEEKEVEGKGCRQKRPAQTLLSPFTDPLRKKRTMSVSAAIATPPCFDPTKPVPIEDVKAVIEFCTAWKNDISAEVQLESFSVGADFFYKLIDDTEWVSSRHLDMATFLIRKRQLSHPLVFGTDWTTTDYCLQQFLEPLKPTTKKCGAKKAAASNTVDLPPNKLKNIHHYVRGTWQTGMAKLGQKSGRSIFHIIFEGPTGLQSKLISSDILQLCMTPMLRIPNLRGWLHC